MCHSFRQFIPDLIYSYVVYLELFEAKSKGILSLLDEELKLLSPSANHFTSEVHAAWNENVKLLRPRKSSWKISDNDGFVVRHFAADVCYSTVCKLD